MDFKCILNMFCHHPIVSKKFVYTNQKSFMIQIKMAQSKYFQGKFHSFCYTRNDQKIMFLCTIIFDVFLKSMIMSFKLCWQNSSRQTQYFFVKFSFLKECTIHQQNICQNYFTKNFKLKTHTQHFDVFQDHKRPVWQWIFQVMAAGS